MVITGASSGIGLTTSRLAAKEGARLVLAARNENAIKQLANEVRLKGGQAVHVVADVGKEEEVRNIAEVAIERFGGFDTWVNDAAIGIYGNLLDIATVDSRRLFDTNFWGCCVRLAGGSAALAPEGGRVRRSDHQCWFGGLRPCHTASRDVLRVEARR